MLHSSRPFRVRLRGLFLIPCPGLPAAAGQSCSPQAGSKEHWNINPHRRGARGWKVFPPLLEVHTMAVQPVPLCAPSGGVGERWQPPPAFLGA